MSRRTTRAQSRHQAQKILRTTARVEHHHLSPGQTAFPARKQAARPSAVRRNHNAQRYTGKAYRRLARHRHTWRTILLGVAVVGLFAALGYLWSTFTLANTSTPISSGGANSAQNAVPTEPKAIPTYQQKSGIIWTNQQLTAELGNQVAQILHLSADQIETALQSMTMSDLAERQGFTVDQWHATILNVLKDDLASLVSSSQFAQSDADTNNTFYAQHPDHLDDSLASLFGGRVFEHASGQA